MIIKLISEHSPTRPSIGDKTAIENWRKDILMAIGNKISPKALARIEEKFLKPQEWRGTASAVTKGVNITAEDEMFIEGVANGIAPDRGRETILSSAWNTENFDLNPIILFNHNHNWPIGTCIEYKVEERGLYYRAVIGKPNAYPCMTETQEMCRSLLAQGILRSSSVGFIPFNIDYDEENDVLSYTEVELIEISLVSVPMQQDSLLENIGPSLKNISSTNAITKGVKAMDKAQYDEMMAMLGKVLEAVNAKKEPPQNMPPVNDGCSSENKSLREKISKLEKDFSDLKLEKETNEKQMEEFLSAVEKTGVKLEV